MSTVDNQDAMDILPLDGSSDDMFYFRSFNEETKEYSKVFAIKRSDIKLVNFFAVAVDGEPDSGMTAENPLELTVKKVVDMSLKDNLLVVGTEEQLEFLVKYITIWSGKTSEDALYIKREPISTNDHAVIFEKQPADYALIHEYMQNKLPETEANKKRWADASVLYGVDVSRVINHLMYMTGDYLGMDCLLNKLYAYTAMAFWKTSMREATKLSGDPFYENIENQAIDEWMKANPDKAELIRNAERIAEEAEREAKAEEAKEIGEAEIKKAEEMIRKFEEEHKKKVEAEAAKKKEIEPARHSQPAESTEPAAELDDEEELD